MTNQQRSEISRKGGNAVVEKYGREHMAEIGRRGAEALHRKYAMKPVGLSKFVLVDRETNMIASNPF